jgi:hypothetical protein
MNQSLCMPWRDLQSRLFDSQVVSESCLEACLHLHALWWVGGAQQLDGRPVFRTRAALVSTMTGSIGLMLLSNRLGLRLGCGSGQV